MNPARIPPTIVIATRNRGKVKEIAELVSELPVQFLSLHDLPDAPQVQEDGETFEENAIKKAQETAAAVGLPVLADDSGLCVDALDGRPGVRSARYAGSDASDADKCEKLLQELEGAPEEARGARFVCVVALVTPEGEQRLFTGVCEGTITREPKGEHGFGYDPIFLYRPAGKTFAQMERIEKNRVSHRGAALKALASYLRSRAE